MTILQFILTIFAITKNKLKSNGVPVQSLSHQMGGYAYTQRCGKKPESLRFYFFVGRQEYLSKGEVA